MKIIVNVRKALNLLKRQLIDYALNYGNLIDMENLRVAISQTTKINSKLLIRLLVEEKWLVLNIAETSMQMRGIYFIEIPKW